MARRKTLSEQLRHIMLNADISRYRLAKEIGLSEAALSHFVHGTSGLSQDSTDKIGKCLGLELVIRRKPKRKRSK